MGFTRWLMSRVSQDATLAVLLFFAIAGCEGRVADSVLSVRDSAGISITTSDVAGAGSVCSLAETPDMRVIGPASGEWTFHGIEDIGQLEDGRLVVLNRGFEELLMFDRDGEFLQSIGRRGEGPGEFLDPIELEIIGGDSIVVWDWDLRRLVLLGPDGSHLRSVMLQTPMHNPTGRMGVLGRDGVAFGSHDYRRSGTRLTPQFMDVLRYDWSGTLVDTLATLPHGELGLADPATSRVLVASPLFEAKGVFSTHGDLLYTSDGSLPEVRAYREKQLESIVRWEPGDLSVREGDLEAHKAAWLEGAGAQAAMIRKSIEAFPAMEVFPAVTDIEIDVQGRMWVRTFRRPRSAATEWLVFENTGAFICGLSVPRPLRVLHFGTSSLAAVHRDEMDVESVEVRSFHLPGG